MCVCLSVTTFLSQILLSAQMGFGGSERVWNGLEGSLDGPVRVPGGSWEGLGGSRRVQEGPGGSRRVWEASLKKVGHPITLGGWAAPREKLL